jgi:hypothetical protein
MKITKRQLRRIIREEKARLQEVRGTDTGTHGIFSSDYLYDLLSEEVDLYLRQAEDIGMATGLVAAEQDKMRVALMEAFKQIVIEFGDTA